MCKSSCAYWNALFLSSSAISGFLWQKWKRKSHGLEYFLLRSTSVPRNSCVLLSSYVYLLYCVCIVVLRTFVTRLLAGSQYPEVPATGHLDTGFSWFPCVYKQMLRWFPRFQVATTCFSCSPPDLNFLDPYFIFMSSLFHIYVHA